MTPERFIEIGTSCLKDAGWPEVLPVRAAGTGSQPYIGVRARLPGTTIDCFNGAHAAALPDMTEAEAIASFTNGMPSPAPRVAVLCRDYGSVREYHQAGPKRDEYAFSFHTHPCGHRFEEIRLHDMPETDEQMQAVLNEWVPRLAPGGKVVDRAGAEISLHRGTT